MKKKLLAAALALTLVGCGTKTKDTTDKGSAEDQTEESQVDVAEKNREEKDAESEDYPGYSNEEVTRALAWLNIVAHQNDGELPEVIIETLPLEVNELLPKDSAVNTESEDSPVWPEDVQFISDGESKPKAQRNDVYYTNNYDGTVTYYQNMLKEWPADGDNDERAQEILDTAVTIDLEEQDENWVKYLLESMNYHDDAMIPEIKRQNFVPERADTAEYPNAFDFAGESVGNHTYFKTATGQGIIPPEDANKMILTYTGENQGVVSLIDAGEFISFHAGIGYDVIDKQYPFEVVNEPTETISHYAGELDGSTEYEINTKLVVQTDEGEQYVYLRTGPNPPEGKVYSGSYTPANFHKMFESDQDSDNPTPGNILLEFDGFTYTDELWSLPFNQ